MERAYFRKYTPQQPISYSGRSFALNQTQQSRALWITVYLEPHCALMPVTRHKTTARQRRTTTTKSSFKLVSSPKPQCCRQAKSWASVNKMNTASAACAAASRLFRWGDLSREIYSRNQYTTITTYIYIYIYWCPPLCKCLASRKMEKGGDAMSARATFVASGIRCATQRDVRCPTKRRATRMMGWLAHTEMRNWFLLHCIMSVNRAQCYVRGDRHCDCN